MDENDYIRLIDILKSANIHRFKLLSRIYKSISVIPKNILDGEYSNLILLTFCLDSNFTSKCMALPSVTYFNIIVFLRFTENYKEIYLQRISDCSTNMTSVDSTNMTSVDIEVTLESTIIKFEVDLQRDLASNVLAHLNPIEKFTLSMDCCLQSAVFDENDKDVFIDSEQCHLKLSKCYSTRIMEVNTMAEKVWNQYGEWNFDSKNYSEYSLVPLDGTFNNTLSNLTITADSPINDQDFAQLMKRLKCKFSFVLNTQGYNINYNGILEFVTRVFGQAYTLQNLCTLLLLAILLLVYYYIIYYTYEAIAS